MKVKLSLLFFVLLSFSALAQDTAPEPVLDSAVVEQIQQLAVAFDSLITVIEGIKQSSPGGISNPADANWWQSLFYIVTTFLLPFLFRRMANGKTKFEQIIGFLGKIKNNGVLAILSAAIAVFLGLVVFPKGDDPFTGLEVVNFLGTFGGASILYILTKLFTGIGTPKPKDIQSADN
ncbi:MAG: hypothetical protein D6765_15675 [Bacteroidetes bacterium]|nr:MAG: hypothetical protein D6765_15675 [Bacteroidota bacterium]